MSSARKRCVCVRRFWFPVLPHHLRLVGLCPWDRRQLRRGLVGVGRRDRREGLLWLLRRRLASCGIRRKSGSAGLGTADRLGVGWTTMKSLQVVWIDGELVV